MNTTSKTMKADVKGYKAAVTALPRCLEPSSQAESKVDRHCLKICPVFLYTTFGILHGSVKHNAQRLPKIQMFHTALCSPSCWQLDQVWRLDDIPDDARLPILVAI